MKSRRRVEIRVERHELSIFSGFASGLAPRDESGYPSASGPPPTPTGSPTLIPPLPPAHSGVAPAHPRCPICGNAEMIPLDQAFAVAGLSADEFKTSLESGSCHLHRSTAGQLLVCRKSLRPG